ncbi:MAG: Por secretion system protein, partial [Paludibacter sp.]
MKRTILMLIVLLTTVWSWAQIITSTPSIAIQTSGVNDSIVIIYDASLGGTTAGLKGYTGTVYAHTGVTYGGTKWQKAPTWGSNLDKYKLTRPNPTTEPNKWKFVIKPNINQYYGLTGSEIVTQLCFVFRSGEIPTGKTAFLEGKDNGADIFMDVKQPGLNVAFTNPTIDQAVLPGTFMTIGVSSSLAA